MKKKKNAKKSTKRAKYIKPKIKTILLAATLRRITREEIDIFNLLADYKNDWDELY